jgi:hopanoid biosynthesis associated RND transporter like protein HpnN
MEGRSERESQWSGPYVALTKLILRHPVGTIVSMLLLAALATLISYLKLGYHTSRNDLLNPRSAYNKLWFEFVEEFGGEDDVVIVVEGEQPKAVTAALESLSKETRHQEHLFHDIFDRLDLSRVKAKGLYQLPLPQLTGVGRQLESLGSIIGPEGSWSQLSLEGAVSQTLAGFGNAAPPDPAAAQSQFNSLLRILDSARVYLASAGQEFRSPLADPALEMKMPPQFDSKYLTAREGKLGLILLRLEKGTDGDSFTHGDEAETELRKIAHDVEVHTPGVHIGLTGLPIMENDEMRSSQTSMLWASIVSMIGVALLFIAGFGGIRHALLANLVLLVGMAWSFAFVTLTVGHLNILSVSFTATLIGIGIDYGIYFAAKYLQLRRDGEECYEALLHTAKTAGPAIATGAVSTAVAFFAAGFTRFTGVAELGIIAGGGLLLCAAAELIMLPACIYLIDRSGWGVKMPMPMRVDRWIAPFVWMPRGTVLATVAFTIFCGQGLTKLWFDNNLMNMQPRELESVILEKKLLEERELSSWYAVSVCDSRDQLLARKAKFEKLPSVQRTEEIASLLPDNVAVKQPIIDSIHDRLATLPEVAPLLPTGSTPRLVQMLAGFEGVLSTLGDTRAISAVSGLRRTLASLPPEDAGRLVSSFQQALASDLIDRLRTLRDVSHPQPPRLSDLPSALTSRFVGKHGKFALRIYGKGNTWNTAELDQFAKDIRRVDPRVTGNPIQAREASLEMKRSYQEAAIYSLLAILGVLVIDFRNLKDTLLASLPLALGVIQSYGIMGYLDIAVNPANLIALPIILGIGVDYGVHIIHEFREQKGRYRMSAGTAVAVMVDALTTIVGYGAMMIATHQGLYSLGRVLTITVTACLVNSMVILPAVLTLLSRNRKETPVAPEKLTPQPSPPQSPVPPAAAVRQQVPRPRRMAA